MSKKDNKMYCGIGDVPKGKVRASLDYCIKNNQVRYYGLVAIDPKVLEKYKAKRTSNLIKEQLKLKRLEDDGKILVKEYRNLKVIVDNKESKPSQIKKAQKRIDVLVEKRDKLLKKLKSQRKLVKQLLKEEKEGSKTSKPKKNK